MGSLEDCLPVKREPSLRAQSSTRARARSRFSRFLLLTKLDFRKWMCAVAAFLCIVVMFQMFLPLEKSLAPSKWKDIYYGDLAHLEETGSLDFGKDFRFGTPKVFERFRKEANVLNRSYHHNLTLRRYGHLKPQLALVFGDLVADPEKLLMATVAAALQDIGYEFQVFSLEDGPVRDVWKSLGASITIIQNCDKADFFVDWLNFNGIIINSLEATDVFTCFLQEPFKSLPLIWTIHDAALAIRLRQYNSHGQIELANHWKRSLNRATAVVFSNYVQPMIFSAFDSGNFVVIPGSPAEAWETNPMMASYKDNIQDNLDLGPKDIMIAIVGSQFLYKGLWLEHALILESMLPLLADFPTDKDSNSHLKIIILSGSLGNYSVAVEAIAHNLRYPSGIVEYKAVDQDADTVLSIADLVIYGSFLEEESFPEILVKAMCYGKPIIAPELAVIKKYVDDGVNGYLFPKDNVKMLSKIIRHVAVKGKVSPVAHNIAARGKNTGRDLMVSETVEGYASLLQVVLKLPSEVAPPRDVSELSPNHKQEWQWDLFETIPRPTYQKRIWRSDLFLDKIEERWNHTQKESSSSINAVDDTFSYSIWEEEKYLEVAATRKRREEQELKDRSDQPRGTWEEVYKSAKKADRLKNDLHERDERELERTGQPLGIYEPYLGEGIWPFLHVSSIYRGIGLSTKGRRPGADDIDAPSRLPLLNNPYYRDALGDFGAYFAIANRIDRIHKNAWIGFQCWRATARKASLSGVAERALLDAIQTRKHGDTFYFWVRMDQDQRNPLQQDFWSFCDSINAGNCKYAFSEALKRMYGLKHDLDALPPMPVDGDTWSVMKSWALPTRSFLEFVMFSRMFVDALDAQMYDEHHQTGHCYLSLSKDKHCYSRVLELLVNVWAFHSARRMVYVDPETGFMQEQHRLQDRRGRMWVKWFSYDTLKSMDEDYAEEYDSDKPMRWLWPSTGEVLWQGVYERERNQRHRQKEKRKQLSKEKLGRMKKRKRQKVIGKYVKPLPEETDTSNSTMVVEKSL
ncbi:uncharacterized protein LOC115753546 [Rhodamnia argentea]|uniref:Uncharacterized protein LOC115753546 n=1 Tax=Rhodamnia argentea TaxID=178133 RepID=A0A8B8QP65_9MYRT|nr:uncharacterized protein LOC115753546 [Rhodamnia argentea]